MKKNHPLRQLDELESSSNSDSGYTGLSRWMIPYADFLTLLLGFFIIMFGMIEMQNQEIKARKAKTPHPQASKQIENFEEDLIKELGLKSHQVAISQDGRGLVISFQERIFFTPGQATLSELSEKTLQKLAPILAKTNRPIRIEGHTDNTPIRTAQFPSNWELSTTRATSIVRSLIEHHQFPAEKLSAAGYGEFYPIANNSTIEGKQKNRRVDIVLLSPFAGSTGKLRETTASKENTQRSNVF